jgi:hypothetical protein
MYWYGNGFLFGKHIVRHEQTIFQLLDHIIISNTSHQQTILVVSIYYIRQEEVIIEQKYDTVAIEYQAP